MSIFQNYDYSDSFTRIDGEKPSISLLGIKYDPTTQWITYNENTALSSEYTKINYLLYQKAP
jgi:hypothetical protein